MACTTLGAVWATLFVQWLWRQGVIQRACRAVLHAASIFDFRTASDRPLYARGFIRVPEGKEPPPATFAVSKSGARVKHPWRKGVPDGAGDLWVATAFTHTDPDSGRCVVTPAEKIKALGEHYSADAESWHEDRRPADRYMRYRSRIDRPRGFGVPIGPTMGYPEPAGANGWSDSIAMSPRAPQPGWLRLASVYVDGGAAREVAVPPMKLAALREIRVVVEIQGAEFKAAEATFGTIERLSVAAIADSSPSRLRLVCTLPEYGRSEALEIVVADILYRYEEDGIRFAIDFIGDPDTGVVDTVAIVGAIAEPQSRFEDVVTVYFR